MVGYFSHCFFEGTVEDLERISDFQLRERFGVNAVRALCPLDHHVITTTIELGDFSRMGYGCICCGTEYFLPFSKERMGVIARASLEKLKGLEKNLGSNDEVQKRMLRNLIEKAGSYGF